MRKETQTHMSAEVMESEWRRVYVVDDSRISDLLMLFQFTAAVYCVVWFRKREERGCIKSFYLRLNLLLCNHISFTEKHLPKATAYVENEDLLLIIWLSVNILFFNVFYFTI